ncbi:MAG: hypothetical protein M0Z53_01975 [Thermaerobacter sp.]|nr:hypothetical protein [Thermaerobacter sp.]
MKLQRTDGLKVLPAGPCDGPNLLRDGLHICNRLFTIERDLRDVTPEERSAHPSGLEPPVAQFLWLLPAYRCA